MRRRVWQKVKEAANTVYHGGSAKATVEVEDTGTCISATRTGEHSFSLNIKLRGDDRWKG